MQDPSSILVLNEGELYWQKEFGPNTINRGAVLFHCGWNGGRFESGLFMAGIFRSGEFLGGIFLGGIFWDGLWIDGAWEGGFGRDGMYRPRTMTPS
jgi:hypothetical protein